MTAAVKSGGMPAVRFQAPDQSIRFVPANRTQDAAQAGGKILPIEQQDVKHPGFWSAVGEDAVALGKSILTAGPTASSDAGLSEAVYQQKLRNEGRSLPYRILMGLTPASMRESAEQGDVAGVAGHTVVPAATVAAGAAAPAVSEAAGTVIKPILQKAAAAAGKITPKQVAQAAGAVTGAGLGHGTLSAPGAYYGAKSAGHAAEGILGERANRPILSEPPPEPELDATGENRPFAGGTDEPPVPKPARTLDATAENRPFAGGVDEPKPARTIVRDPQTGQPEFSDVVAAKQAAATSSPAATAAVKQTPVVAAEPVAAPGDVLGRLQENASRIQAQEAATPTGKAEAASGEDLTQILKDSIEAVKARKAATAAGKPAPSAEEIPRGGVFTTAEPKALLDRWGVDPESFTEGRSQTRGMSPQESEATIKQLTAAYKKGQPPEPVLETRDANNNIVDVDGRGRALAAHRAGVERIPIIVRRMGTAAEAPTP